MTKKYITGALSVALAAGAGLAQGAGKQAVLMAMGAKGKQMAAYRWKQKITVFRRGAPMEPIVEEIRFDATGQPQHLTLSKPAEKRMGPIRARKAAEVKDDIQDVMQLARRYASPQLAAEAIQKGEFWEGQGRSRIQARAIVLPADEMTIAVNGANCLVSRIDVQTRYEGAPITIAIDYEQLQGGPSMMTHMTVQIPKDDIVVKVESYDLVRLAAAMAP